MITYETYSSKGTERLGGRLAKKILSTGPGKQAVVIGLVGELGSGKTTFIKGFFRGLGLRKPAVSPTFILMRRVELKNKRFKNIFHFDAYRIKGQNEILKLGFEEIVENPGNIVLIEWADRIKKLLPPKAVRLEFEHGERENKRTIKVSMPIST